MSIDRSPAEVSPVWSGPHELLMNSPHPQRGSAFLRGGAVCLVLAVAASIPLVKLLAAPPPAKSETESAVEKELLDVAKRGYQIARNLHAGGKLELHGLAEWSRRLLNAELANATTDEERIVATKAHVGRMAEIEKAVRTKFNAGVSGAESLYYAQYAHLDAKLSLERLSTKSND